MKSSLHPLTVPVPLDFLTKYPTQEDFINIYVTYFHGTTARREL